MPDVQPGLFLVPGDDDLRLARFRRAHPGITIRPGQFGTWEALAPEVAGEGVLVRHTLRELLDKLEELFPGSDVEDSPG